MFDRVNALCHQPTLLGGHLTGAARVISASAQAHVAADAGAGEPEIQEAPPSYLEYNPPPSACACGLRLPALVSLTMLSICLMERVMSGAPLDDQGIAFQTGVPVMYKSSDRS